MKSEYVSSYQLEDYPSGHLAGRSPQVELQRVKPPRNRCSRDHATVVSKSCHRRVKVMPQLHLVSNGAEMPRAIVVVSKSCHNYTS
jgi:hypothetical protein